MCENEEFFFLSVAVWVYLAPEVLRAFYVKWESEGCVRESIIHQEATSDCTYLQIAWTCESCIRRMIGQLWCLNCKGIHSIGVRVTVQIRGRRACIVWRYK